LSSRDSSYIDVTVSPVQTGTENTGVTATLTVDSNGDSYAVVEERGVAFRGPLAIEGHPTSDKRMLIPGEISERDLPLPLNVQIQTADGHSNSYNSGRIDSVEHIPFSKLNPDVIKEFGLEDLNPKSVVIWGQGTFDDSEYADEAQRMLSNGAGVSVDIARERAGLFDPETLEEIEDELDLEQVLFGDHIQGIGGKIAGATVVTMPAFEEASIKVVDDRVLVASAYGLQVLKPFALTAAAGPVKPPREWFENPHFRELTPWTVTKDGRCFGHLADWDGCHIGFQGVCVPPFRSQTDYGYFNNQDMETAEGDLVSVGKVMFSRDGVGHASTDPDLSWQDVQRHYDDATCVGALVHAGADRFGTWIAGALAPGLNDLEVQHMRTHGPSGDWRPIRPTDISSELIASLAVPIQGFPIARKALVASANGHISAIITAPLEVTPADNMRSRMRRKTMLGERLRDALGITERTREEQRREALAWLDGFRTVSAEERRRMAKAGTAMPDGSFPIANCSDWDNARRAIGRTPASRRAAVQAHINKRGRALGCSGE
jgi:hypothetical protein